MKSVFISRIIILFVLVMGFHLTSRAIPIRPEYVKFRVHIFDAQTKRVIKDATVEIEGQGADDGFYRMIGVNTSLFYEFELWYKQLYRIRIYCKGYTGKYGEIFLANTTVLEVALENMLIVGDDSSSMWNIFPYSTEPITIPLRNVG